MDSWVSEICILLFYGGDLLFTESSENGRKSMEENLTDLNSDCSGYGLSGDNSRRNECFDLSKYFLKRGIYEDK